MILDLIKSNDNRLKQKLESVNYNDISIDSINNLVETMIYNNGLGITNNQVEGIVGRILLINSEKIIACINPLIVDRSSEEIYLEETCLSHKNMILKVKRPRIIKVRFTQPNGEVITTKYTDLTARVFQRQYDLLNGILFTQRATTIHLEQARNKLKRNKSIK